MVDGIKLGGWVIRQRQGKENLTKVQVKRLNSLGFSWDPHAELWESCFSVLQRFHKREGHCRVPTNHVIEGVKLGSWTNNQRNKKSQLTFDQVRRLDELSFSWSLQDSKWEDGFKALKSFYKREGHCNVPQSFVGKNGPHLGRWVHRQRQARARLDTSRIKRLDSLGFVWKLESKA